MRRFILGFLCLLLLNIHGSSSRGTGLLAQLLKITATQNRPVILILDNRPHIKNGDTDRGDATNDNIYSQLYYKQNRDKDGTPLDDDPSLRTVRYVDTRNDRYDDLARYTPNTDNYETYNDRYTGRNTYDYKITNDNDRYNTRYTDTNYDDTRYTDARYDDGRYDDSRYDDTRYSDARYADARYTNTDTRYNPYIDNHYYDTNRYDTTYYKTKKNTKYNRYDNTRYTDTKHDDTRYDNTRYNRYTGNYNDYNKYTNRYYDIYGYNTD